MNKDKVVCALEQINKDIINHHKTVDIIINILAGAEGEGSKEFIDYKTFILKMSWSHIHNTRKMTGSKNDK